VDRRLNTFLAFYGTRQFRYVDHNSAPMDRVLRHKNPLHNFTRYSLVFMLQVYYSSLYVQVSPVTTYIQFFSSQSFEPTHLPYLPFFRSPIYTIFLSLNDT